MRLESEAQWVAATSCMVLNAEVRQAQQILRRHVTRNGNLPMTPNNHIPEDKELRESVCFFEKWEITLIPSNEQADEMIYRAKDIFTAELLIFESDDLLSKLRDYKIIEFNGRKALSIYERVYGKFSKKALNASITIACALLGMERYDEALDVIMPYRKAMPEDVDLKEAEAMLLKRKKEQDDLFRYDPDTPSATNLEPIG